MNVKKIFKDCVTLSTEEVGNLVKAEYQKLRELIFSIMPVGCFLKMWNVLDLRMVFTLSPEMIEKKLVSQKDVCALCSAKGCPYNRVDYKNLRIIKVRLLDKIYN